MSSEEIEYEDDECEDDGGVYNLGTCGCSVYDGDGGGGGGGDSLPPPAVTVSALGSVPYGQKIDPQISATVSVNTGTAPTGTVNFAMTPEAVPPAEDVVLESDSGTSSIANWDMATLDGNPVIPVANNYRIMAEYSGDDNYDSANGTNILAIEPAQSKSTITNCPSTSVTAGQTQSFSISVTWENEPTTTTAGLATPTGQVILYDNANTGGGAAQTVGNLTTYPASASTATIKIAATGTSKHTITASYEGDGNYRGSTSEPCSMTVVAPPS